jgi:hypothetical protein
MVPLPLRNCVAALYSIRACRSPLYELSTNAPQAVRAIVGSWTTPSLETALLKDVDDTYYFGANGQSCLHTSRLSLSKLRAHLGGDFPLVTVRE